MPYTPTITPPAIGQKRGDSSEITPPAGARRSTRGAPDKKPAARAPVPPWAKGPARGAAKKPPPAVRVPVASPTPIVNPYTAKHTAWRMNIPFVPATPIPVAPAAAVPAPIPAPEASEDDREEFATSIARLLKNKTTYEPEVMLDEEGTENHLISSL